MNTNNQVKTNPGFEQSDAASAGAPRLVELPKLDPANTSASSPAFAGLELLKGVRVSLQVRAGHALTTVGALLDLKRSSLLKLEQTIEAPVEVMLEGQIVARGELVAIDGNFGVRVTEVASFDR